MKRPLTGGCWIPGGYLDWGTDDARWGGESGAGWDGEAGDWGAGHIRDSAAAVSGRRGHRSRVNSSSGPGDWRRGSRQGTRLHRTGLVNER
jgi:hypothetical protein